MSADNHQSVAPCELCLCLPNWSLDDEGLCEDCHDKYRDEIRDRR